LTAGRNDEILTRWNLEKILTNRVRGIDSNPKLSELEQEQVIFSDDLVVELWNKHMDKMNIELLEEI
jgi:hypothetical protein